MMLTLGLFVFMLRTIPYQTMNRQMGYRWPQNDRIGQRATSQFLGVDVETITLSGQLLPELTGGRLSLLALQTMAEQGRAWPLIEGSGAIYGMFVIEKIAQTSSQFFPDGQPRQINFDITLKRVDESLHAMFGDLRHQATELLDKAQKATGITL
ncbi:phage tail protein [Serratia marcescens]|uniref:Phage tail protein n=1 Tax=Serratia marcescens TaxID=615 RepID=A0A1Q4P3G1_SERMA|nr:phage tail protein [Serratia marcescens]OKB67660.1 phage tail protein [Serratia marcescens]